MQSMAYLSFCEHDKMELSIMPKNIAEFFPQFDKKYVILKK